MEVKKMENKKKNFDAQKVGDLISGFVSMIVDAPENVKAYVYESENSIIFEIAVHNTDYGKVIGKGGKLASALRTVLRAIAGSHDKKLILEFSERKN
jgi:hypothetical protein